MISCGSKKGNQHGLNAAWQYAYPRISLGVINTGHLHTAIVIWHERDSKNLAVFLVCSKEKRTFRFFMILSDYVFLAAGKTLCFCWDKGNIADVL